MNMYAHVLAAPACHQLETCIKIQLKILPGCFSHQRQKQGNSVCNEPIIISAIFFHAAPLPAHTLSSVNIHLFFQPDNTGKQQKKHQFSKERKRDCVLFSGWKFTCHWFPLSLSPPLAAVCCLKDSNSGISSNPSATGSEMPEDKRHLNQDAVPRRSRHLLQDPQYNTPFSLIEDTAAGERAQTHKTMPRRFNTDC